MRHPAHRPPSGMRFGCFRTALILLVACSGCGASTNTCPAGAQDEAWLREYVSEPQFAISLCVPADYRLAEPGTWRRPSMGAAIVVKPGLADAEDLDWPCGLDCPPIERTAIRLRLSQGRAAVLEKGIMTPVGHRFVNVALLRIELSPGRWVVVRALHPEEPGFRQMLRSLESVRVERVGLAGR